MSALILSLAVLASAAPSPTLSDLSWLAGTWKGRSAEAEMEEVWLAPRGGLMLGLHRDVAGEKAVSFEHLRIEAKDGTLVYTSSPNGLPPTAFRLKSMEARKVVFENPTHDFPQRILYWSASPRELCARIEGTVEGKLQSESWCWKS